MGVEAMDTASGSRRAWEAPRLGRLKLEADQVLANGCKSDHTSTYGKSSSPCSISSCMNPGS